MRCVVEVNLTQKHYRIACHGLTKNEADFIATSRNIKQKHLYEMIKSNPDLHRPDKITYIPCAENRKMIEFTINQIFALNC